MAINPIDTTAAEEYELPQMAEAGPSSIPFSPTTPTTAASAHKPRASGSRRTSGPNNNAKKIFTLHGNHSIIFDGNQPPNTVVGHTAVQEVSSQGNGFQASVHSPFRRRHNKRPSEPHTPHTPRGYPMSGVQIPSNPAHHDLFLHENPDDHHHYNINGTTTTETVELPDFGGMLGLNAEGEDNYLIAQGMGRDWKRRLFLLMEEPGSSREAFTIHVMSTGGILFSAVLTILSTLPSFHTNPGAGKALFGLDVMIVVLFTIEYIARFVAHSDSLRMLWNWSTSFFAIVDLLAILPFYIEVALQEDTTILFRFSILRTLRLLRVFRAFKYQNQMLFTIEVMYIAVHRSKDALFALSFFLVMALVIFSTLIYFVERGVWDSNLGTFVTADGDPSAFESIPSAAWFVLVTITTVGYGEIIPRSVLGRLFTVPLLVFGLLLIALPSFVLGRNFAIVFDAMQHQLNVPIKAASVRSSLDREAGALPGPGAMSTPHRPETPSSPPSSTFRLADRGIVSGGNQYDALPSGEPSLRTAVTDTSMSGGDAYTRSTSAQGQKRTPAVNPGGAAGVGTPATKDLSNAKLALNQSVLLSHIERLTQVTERQGEMLDRIMSLLDAQTGKQIEAKGPGTKES